MHKSPEQSDTVVVQDAAQQVQEPNLGREFELRLGDDGERDDV